MSFVPLAAGKNQSYVPLSCRLYQAEQTKAGQGSSLACICSREEIPEIKWMAERQW